MVNRVLTVAAGAGLCADKKDIYTLRQSRKRDCAVVKALV